MVVEIAPVLAPPSSPAVLVAQRFEVRNFLSFDSEGESFNFQPLMVFVGPNGAGKTNLLKALDALSRLCRGWYVRPSDWQHRRPQSIASFGFFAISWTEGDRQFDYEVELGSNKGQDFIMRESLLDRSTGTTLIRSDERATLYRAIIRTSNGEERYADLEHATPRERTVVSLLGDQAPFQASANLRRLLTDYEIHARWRDRPMGLLVDGRSLRADGSNLPAVLAKLGRSGAQLQLLSKDLSDAAGEGSTLIPTSESAWHAIVAGVEFDSSSLSDGTQLWMHLMALLRNPDRTGPIAIDEPEVGLHPDLIDGFVRRVVELARTDAPVIMVTHSGQLLDSLQVNGEEDALRVVERVDDRTVISSPEPELVESWLKDMMLGEAWSAGAFGGNRW